MRYCARKYTLRYCKGQMDCIIPQTSPTSMSTGRPSYDHECKDRTCHWGQFFLFCFFVVKPKVIAISNEWKTSPPAHFLLSCLLQGSPQEIINLHLTWLASSFSLILAKKRLTGVFRLIEIPTLSFLHSIQPMNLKFNQFWVFKYSNNIFTERLQLDNVVWHTARSWSELQSNPRSSQCGRSPKTSLTARVLDASVRLWTGQLATASHFFFLPYAQYGSGRQQGGVKVTLVWVRQMSHWTRCPWRDLRVWLTELRKSRKNTLGQHSDQKSCGKYQEWNNHKSNLYERSLPTLTVPKLVRGLVEIKERS